MNNDDLRQSEEASIGEEYAVGPEFDPPAPPVVEGFYGKFTAEGGDEGEGDGNYAWTEQRLSATGTNEDKPGGRSGTVSENAAREFDGTTDLFKDTAFCAPMYELRAPDGSSHYRFYRSSILPEGVQYGDLMQWSPVAETWVQKTSPAATSVSLNDRTNGVHYLTPATGRGSIIRSNANGLIDWLLSPAVGDYCITSKDGVISWEEFSLPDGTGMWQVRYWHHDANPDNREWRLSNSVPGTELGYTYMSTAGNPPAWMRVNLLDAQIHADCYNATPDIGKFIVGKDYGAGGKLWNALAAPATPSVIISDNVDGAAFIDPPTAKYQVLTTDANKVPVWDCLRFAGA